MENENFNVIENVAEATLISGTDGNDSILSSGNDVTIDAGTGADTLVAVGKSNVIRAEDDNFIAISGDDSTIITGSGDDTIVNYGGENVFIDAGGGTNQLVNTGSGAIIIGGSGEDFILNSGENGSVNSGSGDDYVQFEGSENALGNIIADAGSGNDTLDIYDDGVSSYSGYVSVNGGEGNDIILSSYAAESVTVLGGAGRDFIFNYVANAQLDGGAGNDFIFLDEGSSGTTIIAGEGYDTIEGYNSTMQIKAKAIGSGFIESDAIILTEDGMITVVNGKDQTINLNGNDTIISGNVNTGVDIMKNFFKVLSWYADDTTTDGVEILSEAVRAVSFYSDLYEAVDAFTYMITDDSVYADTYERLYQTCGIVLGDDGDYTVDTGAASGYNAGGSEVKNAYDIVPEPAGATLSEQEMPEAGSTKAVSFYGNDGTYHTFTITAPENFHTVRDDENDKAMIDVSDDPDKLALIEACAKGINAWWLQQSAKLAYDSYGLDFDGANVTYGFSINADYLGVTGKSDDTIPIVDSTPNNEITIFVCLDAYEDMNLDDNPSGMSSSGEEFLDRILAHEFIHATMFKAGLLKRNMPQFFTEGVADLVQGNDDYAGSYTGTIENFAEDYRKISRALVFKEGTGSSNSDAYPGGYAFLRWLIHQNLNTQIVIGTDAADVYKYYGGYAVVSGYGEGDTITYGANSVTRVDLFNGDYFIGNKNGTLLLRGFADKTVALTDYAAIDNETFKITNATGSMLVGAEYLTFNGATAAFDLSSGNISVTSGAVTGFAGGSYTINGETVTLGAADTITAESGSVTLNSGDVEIFENTVTGGANATLTSYTGDELTDQIFGSTVIGSNAILYTSNGNITVLDGASLLGISAEVSKNFTGLAGTDYNDTLSATDKEFPLINGRGGDDLIIFTSSGSTQIFGGSGIKAQIFGGSGNDTVSVTGGESASIDAGAGNDFITLSDAESATVIFSAGSDTLDGYNSTTRISATEIVSVTSSGSSVVISGSTGSLTVTDASADEVIISHSIFHTVEGAEVVFGDGDDSVMNTGGSSKIYSGGGNDTVLSYADSVTVSASGGDNIIVVGGASNVVYTGAGDDSIEVTGTANTIYIGGGDDLIDEYTSDTNIIAQVTGVSKRSNDAILTTDDGTITILGGADKTIIVNGEELAMPNLNTGVDIMKNFFNVLSWYADDTTTDGVEILNEAVRAVSIYRDLSDAIDNFIYDLTQGEDDWETRLLNTANMILNDEDTGAVSGYHAGGAEILNAEDIVPESVTSLAEVALPEAGSTSTYTVTGNDGTEITFNVKWQDSFTAVRDQSNGFALTELTDQVFGEGEDTVSAESIREQNLTVFKGMTLWFPAAVKLAYDSYGLSFNGKTINAYTDVNAIYLAVTSVPDDLNYDKSEDTIEIGFNMSVMVGDRKLDPDDPNGAFNYPIYIDRVLAHEMIHAVMFGNGVFKTTMPEFFTEGVAELVHGAEDERSEEIESLAKSYRLLYGAMNLIPGTGSAYSYPAGYSFLRYLINQNLNTEIVFGTDEEDVYEYYGGDAVVNSFDSGDKIVVDTSEKISSVELSNGDVLITSDSGRLMIRGGNAAVVDSAGEEITPTAEEETVSGASEINNSENAVAVVGGSGADTITNSGIFGFIDGRAGDDLISNSGNVNIIQGGAGNDSIVSSGDAISMDGGAGDDFISLSGGKVTIETSAGNDTVKGVTSDTVIIINNPIEVSENLIVTDNGTLNVEGSDYSFAYKIITNATNTLVSGSSGNDTIQAARENVSVDAGGGNDVMFYNKGVTLVNLYDSITSIEFDFTEEGLKLKNGDDEILLKYYTSGELHIDGHNVYAIKGGNNIAYDSSVDYYNIASNATLSGLSAGESVVVNGTTFEANSEGTEITNAGYVVWSGSAEDLAAVNLREVYDNSGGDTVDTDTLVQIVNETLKRGEDGSPPAMAQLFFHPDDEDGNEDPTLPASSETLTINSSDGLKLVGRHFAPETSDGNWVILITGYGHTKKSMYPFVDAYISLGYDVLAIDPRAAGDSEGEYMTMGTAEAHDVALWTQKIAEIDSNARIVLHGVSMGAATAMLAAANEDTTNVTGIIEDCGYTSVRNVFVNVVSNAAAAGITFLEDIFSDETVYDTFFEIAENLTGYDVAAAAPINVISDVTVSSLFINGDDDSVAPASGAQELYEASGAENKKILIVEGAGHAASMEVDSEAYVSTVSEFILSSNSEGYIAQDDTLTIDGVTYTAVDSYANLNLDSDGKVAGITTGKVTAEIADAETTPAITFDATDGGFEFTATVANSALKVGYEEVNISYVSGAVTYTASAIEIPAGEISLVGTGSIPLGVALNFPEAATATFADGTISASTENVSGAISVYGMSIGTLAVSGDLSYNQSTKEVTFAKDAALDVNISLLNNFAISMTALEDVSGTFEFSTSPMGATFTPSSESGSVQLVTKQGDVTNFNGEINCRAGSMTFGLDGGISLASGTVMDVTVNGMALTLTASGDAPSKLAIENGKMAIEPGDGSALGIALNSGTQVLNGNLKLTSGKIVYDPSANEITVAKDTELQIDFGNDYLVTLTATDEAGGTLTLGTDGITFAPNSDDGGLELSITRDGETRTASLDVTGSVTYKLDGSISLAEGTVVTNTFEDGNILTITAKSDATGSILFDPENGLTITPAEADALSVLLSSGEIEVFDITSISGSINYKGGVITASDGTSAHFTNYYMDSEMELRTSGGSSSLIITDETTSYIANEGATFVLDYLDGDTLEITGGRFVDDYENAIVTAGSTFRTNDDESYFVLETAGDYNVNGAAITTTEDGVEVWLSNYDTVQFEADGNVIFNGETLSGDVKIVDGEIASIEDNVHVMYENGESFTTGSREFNMISDAPTGVTVTTGNNTFEVAHQITEAEVEAFDDTTSEDLGEIFEEKVTIAGDDSYTVSSRAFGVSIVSGLSNGASVNAAVVFDGVENEFGTGFKFVTDEEGTFTFGNKTYTIAGDDNVTMDVSFNADGTAAVDNFDGLDEGASIMTDGEIINNLDNRTITGDESDDIITNSGSNVTINAGDGDNEISNSGDGAVIIAGSGDDTISNTDADNVLINAGAGDNSINSGCDNVTIISENGNDTIIAEGSNNSITAGEGDDDITIIDGDANQIDAGNGNNIVLSYLEYTVDAEADTLKNYYESETVITGSGNDTIANYGGYYVNISAGDGNDSIRIHHSYYNTVDAGAGDDIVILQNGHYQNVNAGAGNDTIIGSVASGSGNWATGGYATLIGGEGDDYINPSYANDSYIEGGSGNDTIISRGPRQTIDAGDGDDVVSLSSANAGESRTETTTSNLIITGGGDDTIYGYETTTTIQASSVISSEMDGKDVVLTTDEGTVTIVKGVGKVINVDVDGELQQIANGEYEISEPATINGMAFSGSGKVTLSGSNVTLGAGVAVDGVEEVVLTKKGFNTINGQSFWLTEKVPVGVTVSTVDDGIGMAHIVSEEEDFAEDVGKIFYEEARVYGDDSYGVRIDEGGIRSFYNLSDKTTVVGVASLETAVNSGEFVPDYSILQLGLSEAGTYVLGDEEITIGSPTSDTPVGVNARYESDGSTAISFVRYLNGNTIAGDFTNRPVIVGNDKGTEIVSIAGDDSVSITGDKKRASVISGVSSGATLYGAGKADKFTTDETGEFTVVNYGDYAQNFTVEGDDSVDFVLSYYTNSDGKDAFKVEGIYNFESGSLIFDENTAYHAFNIADKKSGIDKSQLIHFGEFDGNATVQVADSKVSSISGVSFIEDFAGDATIHGTGNMTVNGAEIYVDGDDDFNVIVSEGKVASIVGLDDGATLNMNTSAAIVAEDGTFAFGFTDLDAGSIEVNSKTPVIFNTDKYGELSSIENLDGTIYISTAETFDAPEALAAKASAVTVNGARIGMDGSTKVSVSGDGKSVTEISGFENGTTITGDIPVVLENDSTVTVNETTFALSGDKNSVAIDGSEITGLDAGASLKVSSAGIYTVNGTAFDAKKADTTFIATSEGVYIYDPNNMPVTTDTATEDILTRFDVIAEPETVKTGETDLSTETVAAAVSLTSGDQSVTFNNRGSNAAVVSKNANGRKDIGLGDGGDVVVVEDTGADVSITSGAGDDTIVNQGTNTYIDMAAGGADKVYALGGTVTLDNYHASTGSGLQTEFSDIGTAIENGKIQFRSGEVSISGANVFVNDGYDDSTLVDFYDINGNEQRVGFTNTEGGSIDLSTMKKSAILIGGMQAASSLVGTANDDTIYAAAGDTINGYGGDNLVKLSKNRKINADGAAIEIPAVRSATIVENFKTGFDAGDDYIRADVDVSEVSYVSGDIVIKQDESKVLIKDVGDGSSAKFKVDNDNAVAVARGATVKVADEIADYYIGKKSALDFSDDYERDVLVNLAANNGAVGAHSVYVSGFNKITVGGGKTTLIGSDENEEFYAGSNDNTLYGGGGRDTLHGYSGSDKNGSTEFFFDKDRATITGFEFTDGKAINPDKIKTGAQGVEGVGVNGDDVYIELFNGGRLMIDGAAGKDFAIANDYGDVVAQISGGDLTYDGRANYFSTTTKARAKVEVSSEVDNAEVWLNNGRSDEFHGNIYELDASAIDGNATLVGNDFDNVITAGSGNSSLWGGNSTSNDTLIGGDGKDLFWYEMGNGNDEIHGAGANDSVNLYGITVDMLTTEVTADSIKLIFNNGQTLKLDTNDGTTFQLADGSNWTYDKSNSSWKTK